MQINIKYTILTDNLTILSQHFDKRLKNLVCNILKHELNLWKLMLTAQTEREEKKKPREMCGGNLWKLMWYLLYFYSHLIKCHGESHLRQIFFLFIDAINGNDIAENLLRSKVIFSQIDGEEHVYQSLVARLSTRVLLRVKMIFVMQYHIAIIIISSRLSSILTR